MVLVIVDLQTTFLDIFKGERKRQFWRMMGKIEKKIEKATHVIVLSTIGDGPLVTPLKKIIQDSQNVSRIGKTEWDGGVEVLNKLTRLGLQKEPIELCGAFREKCVLMTWKTLRAQGANVAPVERSMTISLPKTRAKYPGDYLKRRERPRKPSAGLSEELNTSHHLTR